jgi:two-component system OmpR family response regulator
MTFPQNDPALSLAETQPVGNVGRMKILIIEDDLEAAAYLTKAFREAGIIGDHASDGESGLSWGPKTPMM